MSEDTIQATQKPQTPIIRTITSADILEALAQGMRDFRAAPQYGLFFGTFYAAAGWFLLYLFNTLEINYFVYPMATGFAMVAPFIAAGLYDVSHRLELGQPLSWSAVLNSVRTGGGKDLTWMVLVTTFAYIIWLDIAFALYVVFYGLNPLDFQGLVENILTTPTGAFFFLLGNLVGAILSLVVYSITVISFPLLFDRHVDFITAMITSVKAVLANPRPMLLWCAIIALLFGVSLLSVFVGLIIVLPILGHATWHLYRRLIAPE